MVTASALAMGRALGLTRARLRFMEEATMLHDIGIVRTDAPGIGCYGERPYIAHVEAGREILEAEGYPEHARVAATHIGLGGLTAEEITRQGLPLPAERDFVCRSEEERIVSLADTFYSKHPSKLFDPKPYARVRAQLAQRDAELAQRLDEWAGRYALRRALPAIVFEQEESSPFA
jgi:uncharacterized protein